MLSTLNPACPLCGLRFENKPLLDLHIREDHRQRVFRERNDESEPGSTRAPASGAEGLPDPADPAATPSWTSKKAARPAGRGRADRAKTALWRALRALHKSSANYGAPQVRLWASSHTAVPPSHGAPPQKRTLAWRMTARAAASLSTNSTSARPALTGRTNPHRLSIRVPQRLHISGFVCTCSCRHSPGTRRHGIPEEMLSPDPGSARETLLRDQAWFLHSHGKRRSPSVNSSRGCPRVAGQPALTGRNVGPQGTRQWGQISPCRHHRGARRPAYL